MKAVKFLKTPHSKYKLAYNDGEIGLVTPEKYKDITDDGTARDATADEIKAAGLDKYLKTEKPADK